MHTIKRIARTVAMTLILTLSATPLAQAAIGDGARPANQPPRSGQGQRPSNRPPRPDQGRRPSNSNPRIGDGARPGSQPPRVNTWPDRNDNNRGRPPRGDRNGHRGGDRSNHRNDWNRPDRDRNNHRNDWNRPDWDDRGDRGRRPPYRHHHDDDDGMSTGEKIAVGAGLAILLGAIIANNNSKSSSPSANASDVRTEARKNAKSEADRLAKLISDNGINEGIDKLANAWRDDGKTARVSVSGNITTVYVSGFSSDTKIDYIVDRGVGTVMARVTVNEYKVTEEYTENIKVAAYPTSQYLGFTLADRRNNWGFPVIYEVTRDTQAYGAGMRAGDVLTDVGGTEIRGLSNAQIGKVVSDNARDHSRVSVTFSHNGSRRTYIANL